MSQTLTTVRRRTSAKLRNAEIPACFVDATISSAARKNTRSPGDRRRERDHALKLAKRGVAERPTTPVPAPMSAEAQAQGIDLGRHLRKSEPQRVRETERVWGWL
jgi:hypothetical protein